MARVKVRLADNIARVVFIENEATIGATLGTNVFLNGEVATPASLREWLGVTASGSAAQSQHRLLQGLTVGNDHPQYTRRATLTAEGDLYVRGENDVVRLPVGNEGELLQVVAGVPAWAPGVSGNLSFVTIDDETASLPNSFMLAAGANVTIDAYDGIATINALSVSPNLSFVTIDDETASLPNSFMLAAGTNVTIDAYDGIVTISAEGGGSGGSAQVDVFSTPGTTNWPKPAGAKSFSVYLVGGGGGGGGGRRTAASTSRPGGAGGGGGGVSQATFDAADFGSTIDVVVGAGGPGAAPMTASSGSAFNGTAGGLSSFGNLISALGGGGGEGGSSTSTATPGAGGSGNIANGGTGGTSNSSSGASAPTTPVWAPSGGGFGGGVPVGNTQHAGGAGGAKPSLYPGALAAGTAGAVGGGAGGAGNGGETHATGGGGGGSSNVNTVNGGDGGDGGSPGGGGGGGGAAVSGGTANGGAGGDGANGLVIVVTHF